MIIIAALIFWFANMAASLYSTFNCFALLCFDLRDARLCRFHIGTYLV